jgi:hypothetical protein
MSLLHSRKSTSSPSYLGFKLAPIWMVLVGSSASICMDLAFSTTLKTPDEGGIAGPGDVEVSWRLRSLNLATAAATLMLSYLQFSSY